jgi:hypothetical protein
MNRVYESRLSIHSGLMTMGRRGRSRAREVVVIAQRRSSGFSPMVPLGGRTVEMTTRQRSTEVAGGAQMGRWLWARGGDIGVGVGAVDNGGGLISLFIGP